MINIIIHDKIFYKLDSEESNTIILESILDKNNLFLDILELLNKYSEFISKIIINKSLDEHYESQIQITISQSKIKSLTKNIKKLNYKELCEVK